jgi:hypothetical protein
VADDKAAARASVVTVMVYFMIVFSGFTLNRALGG